MMSNRVNGTPTRTLSPKSSSRFQLYSRTTERKEDVLYYTFEQDNIQQIVNLL